MTTIFAASAPKRAVVSGATLAVGVLGCYLLALAVAAGPVEAVPTAAAGVLDLAVAAGLWRL